MTARHSTPTKHSRKSGKPVKPQKDFPLTAHPSGQWCKKVLGKIYYFGTWDDPQAAFKRWIYRKITFWLESHTGSRWRCRDTGA